MKRRAMLVALLEAAVLFSASISDASGGPPASVPVTVTVSGIPGNGLTPFSTVTLTTAQLAALPEQTEQVTIDGVPTTEQGPLLSAVLADAGLKFLPGSQCKNDELRYFAEATSANGAAAEVTPGELDPFFGDKPAILSVNEAGSALVAPRLIVPGDATAARDLSNVINIAVGRAAPQLADTATPGCTPAPFTAPVTAPAPGSVLINGDVVNPTTLTWQDLEQLPQVSQTVTSLGLGTNVTESGPTLLSAIDAAGGPAFDPSSPSEKLRFYVEVTSSEDGYAATVSWVEIDPTLNGNQILLSLSSGGVSQESFGPKLTVPGDTHAGRFVSGTAVITVFPAPSEAPTPGSGPNLQGENLRGASLASDFLVGATIQGANLNGAQLAGAFLDAASLPGANLNNADLAGAFLNGAALEGANLHEANLSGADLTESDLRGANLRGANLAGVVWSNTTCPDGSNSDADGGTCVNNL